VHQVWARTYALPGKAGSQGVAVAVDKAGNAFVVGVSCGATSVDALLVRLQP
jgi:hypothetical protein